MKGKNDVILANALDSIQDGGLKDAIKHLKKATFKKSNPNVFPLSKLVLLGKKIVGNTITYFVAPETKQFLYHIDVDVSKSPESKTIKAIFLNPSKSIIEEIKGGPFESLKSAVNAIIQHYKKQFNK